MKTNGIDFWLSFKQQSEFENQNVENQHSGILASLKTDEFTLENRFFDYRFI
ncbi:hypothetical protein [Psychroflexus sp. ALD_RP9]|uniref:hypothetical protein n=1 Tax=Psychroflexus sp. ALD_RP9 TaxID=2777186 RepID=UPI001A8D9EE3|nr:hypothetical protein [Psychroflexus sp. ALD_RP9]QSS96635.1 hypothetical protein IMZ30_09300 [Psychroflexus sp. ALD_RP9]QSS96664.1 hypothetical protein IMZ30_09445 [Psychroflexus sp. ALD_RP9]